MSTYSTCHFHTSTNYSKMRFLVTYLLVLSSNFLAVLSDCSSANISVNLYNPASGFVLDVGSDYSLMLYPLTGFNSQLFKIQPSSRIGLFNIIHASTGLAVDIERTVSSDGYFHAVVSELTDSVYQQWFLNAEGTIINGGYYNHALDIKDGVIEEETPIIVWDRYDDDAFDNEIWAFSRMKKLNSVQYDMKK